MDSTPWKLQQDRACLAWDGLSGSIHLLRPGDGLTDLRLADGPLPRTRVLGIAAPGFMPRDAEELIECRVRAGDLAAAYRESAAWPVRLDTLWRSMPLEGALGAIELVLSVRTYSLDCRPELTVLSVIKADEVLAVAEDGTSRPFAPTAEGWTAVGRARPCCVVFRMAGAALSYAEMVHPGDFQRDELLRESAPIVPSQLRHWLFPAALEKGVILRARIRGFFLPRDHDLHLAATASQAFAASEPPLD